MRIFRALHSNFDISIEVFETVHKLHVVLGNYKLLPTKKSDFTQCVIIRVHNFASRPHGIERRAKSLFAARIGWKWLKVRDQITFLTPNLSQSF